MMDHGPSKSITLFVGLVHRERDYYCPCVCCVKDDITAVVAMTTGCSERVVENQLLILKTSRIESSQTESRQAITMQ